MKPAFALHLTQKGVRVFHRRPGGWVGIGDAEVDSPVLELELKHLLHVAMCFEPKGVSSILVLPNTEIKYIKIPVENMPQPKWDRCIHEKIRELELNIFGGVLFDWVHRDGTLLVAIVPYNTLAEAEAFACRYRYNPLCFTAVPEDEFLGFIPNFGRTQFAVKFLGDDTLEPENMPVTDAFYLPSNQILTKGFLPSFVVGLFDGVQKKWYLLPKYKAWIGAIKARLVEIYAAYLPAAKEHWVFLLASFFFFMLLGIGLLSFLAPSSLRLKDAPPIVANKNLDGGGERQADEAALGTPDEGGEIRFIDASPPPSLDETERSYRQSGILTLAPEAAPAPEISVLSKTYISADDARTEIYDALALVADDSVPPPPKLLSKPYIARTKVSLVATQNTDAEQGARKNEADIIIATQRVIIASGMPVAPPVQLVADFIAQGVAYLKNSPPLKRPSRRIEEIVERQKYNGLLRAELEVLKPVKRPISEKTRLIAERVGVSSKLAVLTSNTPQKRPAKLAAEIKKITLSRAKKRQALQRKPITSWTPRSLAKAATSSKALSLQKISLIGVFGTPSKRRALVRLRNGRIVKVSVGDRLNGGRVAVISERSLKYVQAGKTITLSMPRV